VTRCERRAFCDASGRPLGSALPRREQHAIERQMRLFYRHSYTHHRHMATQDEQTASLLAVLSLPEHSHSAPAAAAGGSGAGESRAASSEGEEEGSLWAGSRGREEGEELRAILAVIGSSASLFLDLRCAPGGATTAPARACLAVASPSLDPTLLPPLFPGCT